MHVQVEESPKRHSQPKNFFQKYKLLIMVMGALICMGGGAYLMFAPVTPEVTQPLEPTELPHYQINLTYDYGILPSAYDQHLIKIEHTGGETVENMSAQLWITLYPPDSTPYLRRTPVVHVSKYLSFEPGDVLYIYLGKNQIFYASKELPEYDEFVDFPAGKWGVHVDDARHQSAISQYSFEIEQSKTKLINRKTDKSINQMINEAQPYDTIFISGDQIYHEQILMDGKSVRLYGNGGPIIDAGGIGSAITIANCSYGEIYGFGIQNSGTRDPSDSGIYLLNSDHISIKNNSLQNNQNGLYLSSSDENDIRNNIIQVNDIAGIQLAYGSSKNTIKNNYVGLNTIGIYIKDSSDSNYIVLNTGGGNSRYGILIENKLKNMYEYNNMTNDRMSYNKVVEDQITYYSQDKTNEDAWLAPDRKIGLHESV